MRRNKAMIAATAGNYAAAEQYYADLDGSNDYLTLPASLNISTDFSFTMWLNFTSAVQRSILTHNANAANYSFQTNTDGASLRWRPNAANTGSNDTQYTSSLNDGIWHPVGGAYQFSTKTIRLVYNDHANPDLIGTSTPTADLVSDWKIGTGPTPGAYLPFKIANLKMYNRFLSIDELFNNFYGRHGTGLVGEYLFNANGTIITDTSGNGNNGAAVNGAKIGLTKTIIF